MLDRHIVQACLPTGECPLLASARWVCSAGTGSRRCKLPPDQNAQSNFGETAARRSFCFPLVSQMSASLIGRSRSSAFRLSTAAVSMSLMGSCFSSESALRPFHHVRAKSGHGTLIRSPRRRVRTAPAEIQSKRLRGFHVETELGGLHNW